MHELIDNLNVLRRIRCINVSDFVFSEPSSGSTQALQIPFDGRTSIHLYTDTYTSLIRLNFYINEIPFFISGFQAGIYVWIRRY